MAATKKRKLQSAETSASKRRKLNEQSPTRTFHIADDIEMKLNEYLKRHNPLPPLLCTITMIKNYLFKRNDILFPITDMICVFIGGSIGYFCAEIIEIAGDFSKDRDEITIRPIHIYYAIHRDDELNNTFKQKLIEFMYPIITETCSMFYRFMDQENTNEISFDQFQKGMRKLNLYIAHNAAKSTFDDINGGNNDFITIQDWKAYFNENNHNRKRDDMIQTIYEKCSRWFDILNQSELNQEMIENQGFSEFMAKYSSSIEDEIQHRMNVVMDNIQKYIKNETDQSIYHHKNENNGKGDDNTKYILTEHGLYKIIFKYLSYEDILNGVYQIQGMLQQISLTVLNETYSEFVYCQILKNAIYESLQLWYNDELKLSKDSCLILNALLMDMMNKIIKEINIKYTKCIKEEHEFCWEDMTEILENAGVNGGELCRWGCNEPAKIINRMLNFKENMLDAPINREKTEFLKNMFAQ